MYKNQKSERCRIRQRGCEESNLVRGWEARGGQAGAGLGGREREGKATGAPQEPSASLGPKGGQCSLNQPQPALSHAAGREPGGGETAMLGPEQRGFREHSALKQQGVTYCLSHTNHYQQHGNSRFLLVCFLSSFQFSTDFHGTEGSVSCLRISL